MIAWQDLGDDELHSRLYNKGVRRPSPAELIRRREEPAIAKLIGQLLAGKTVRNCLR